MKRYTLFILSLLFTMTVSAQVSDFFSSPKHEVRAVWLTTLNGLDWPKTKAKGKASMEQQKSELVAILNQLQAAGINTVMLQTRVRSAVIYPSAIEPYDACLTGKTGTSPGYDPLQFAIDECHKRGMELHAWVVTIPLGKWNLDACKKLRAKQGKLVKKVGDEAYFNPEQAGTASYLTNICAEITEHYDIDGIHLDYIRYPENWKRSISNERARDRITAIASAISQKVKTLKPWVKMSCSPIGKYDDLPSRSSRGWNARTRVCQDAQMWLKEGIMDQLYPMMYFRDENFYPFLFDWQQNSYGRTIVSGLGIYFLSPSEKDWELEAISREMEVARQLGVGQCFFRSKFFTDNVKGIYTFARNCFYTAPALIPPMTWCKAPTPDAPTHLTRKTADDTVLLTWEHPSTTNPSGSGELKYVVYASYSSPVDISNPNNIVATYLTEPRIAIPKGENFFYAVTAVNRYGMESEPVGEELTE